KTCIAVRRLLYRLKDLSPGNFAELRELIELELGRRIQPLDPETSVLEQFLRWSLFERDTEFEEILSPPKPPSFNQAKEVLIQKKLSGNSRRLPDYMFLFGRLMTENRLIEPVEFLDAELMEGPDDSEITTEKEAPAMDKVRSVSVSKTDQEDSVLLHSFEKVECLDDYNGVARDFDGTDELDDHTEAMKELNLRQIIRTNEMTHSVYRADIRLNSDIGDLSEITPPKGIPYPEWDLKNRRYRQNWCWIIPKVPDTALERGYADEVNSLEKKTITRLKRRLEAIRFSRLFVPRQTDGEKIDMDAIVDNQCLIKARQTPSERVYFRKDKKQRDLATLILVDLSLSADSYISGKKILDISKESLVIIGKVLEKFPDQVEVAGFYSSTRKECNYLYLKKFHEPWDALYSRVANLEARGYTRIGPALRHATKRLSKLSSKKKNIILLSDGKPNDYDKYEGLYGIGDIRQAIREATAKDIHMFALAISNHAYDYLPSMLGRRQYAVLKKTEDLVHSLGNLYQQFMA
ncbi:MAG: VWA domain-containing protein, partial [Deltaproteobacteria bacterium]|nr:VWA domain-containing protein [Deltaproteobacteria bacterium]